MPTILKKYASLNSQLDKELKTAIRSALLEGLNEKVDEYWNSRETQNNITFADKNGFTISMDKYPRISNPYNLSFKCGNLGDVSIPMFIPPYVPPPLTSPKKPSKLPNDKPKRGWFRR